MLKKEIDPNQNYQNKITNFILDHEINKKNLNILEFGVQRRKIYKNVSRYLCKK